MKTLYRTFLLELEVLLCQVRVKNIANSFTFDSFIAQLISKRPKKGCILLFEEMVFACFCDSHKALRWFFWCNVLHNSFA